MNRHHIHRRSVDPRIEVVAHHHRATADLVQDTLGQWGLHLPGRRCTDRARGLPVRQSRQLAAREGVLLARQELDLEGVVHVRCRLPLELPIGIARLNLHQRHVGVTTVGAVDRAVRVVGVTHPGDIREVRGARCRSLRDHRSEEHRRRPDEQNHASRNQPPTSLAPGPRMHRRSPSCTSRVPGCLNRAGGTSSPMTLTRRGAKYND